MLYIYIHISMYVYIYVCIYIYIHMYNSPSRLLCSGRSIHDGNPKSYPHPRRQDFPKWKNTSSTTGEQRTSWRQESGDGDKFLAAVRMGAFYTTESYQAGSDQTAARPRRSPETAKGCGTKGGGTKGGPHCLSFLRNTLLMNMRKHAKTCENMRKHAKTCENFGLEWAVVWTGSKVIIIAININSY